MNLLRDFFLNLPFELPNNVINLNKELNVNPLKEENSSSSYLYSNYNQILLSFTNKNIVFFQILPFFEKAVLISRKSLDFQIWAIIIKLRYFGYHKIDEVKKLLLELANKMNNARYLDNTDFYTIRLQKLNKIINSHPHKDVKAKLILRGPLTISSNKKSV